MSSYRIEAKVVPWHDRVDFHTKRWVPANTNIRALLLFVHGFAEHTGRYDEVWPAFAKAGIEVYGYDQRGFGRSGPQYGDTSHEQQIQDVDFAIREERSRLDHNGQSHIPLYVYGHSMGGGTVLSLCTRPEQSDSDPPSQAVLSLVPWLAWLVPHMPYKKALDASHATSDPERIQSFQSDPLCRGDVYLKVVTGPLLAGYRLLAEDYKQWPASLPLLISHGEKDPSTSPAASIEFVGKIEAEDKEVKTWPSMLHEGHNERPELRNPFMRYTLEWIEARLPGR